MTFIPQVLTKDDPNNSTTGSTSYTGTATDTTGYDSLIVQINDPSGSNTGGLQIKFSSDTNFTSSSIFYSDTVFANSGNGAGSFIKTYPILKKYYKISYDSSGSYSINCRLSTQTYNSSNQNSISAFENSRENIMDAFGKLRVSNPQTLIDLRVPGQDTSGIGATGATGYRQNEIQICWGITGYGASSGYTGWKNCTNSQTDIYIGGTGTFTNQSRKYCVYQPGKSLLLMASGVMDAYGALTGSSSNNANGVASRIGYFDNYNGLFFEYIANGNGGGTGYIKVRTTGNGSTSIAQFSWNIDKMDGTGRSGLKLNWTKAQLFVIDMEWLGVGRVRYGFYAYGQIQYCHEITNINSIGMGPYTYNINLPVRYELLGNTVADSSGAMIQICSTVISEGGYTPVGRPFSVSVPNVGLSGETPLLYLRGGNSYGNYYHQQILPTDLTIATSAVGDIGILRMYLYFPVGGIPISTSGIIWQDVNTNFSVAQYSTSGTIDTNTTPPPNKILVYQTVISGRGSVNLAGLGDVFTDLLQITSDVNNNSAILSITVQPYSGNGNAYLTLSWIEIY